ncbi:MAG: alpha/beta hydrolase [Flavobacteriia bacterium]|nr:alpha/beta hydrolase [Flavobacteriia bacterium]
MEKLFKTQQGKNAILNLYDEKLDELDIDFEYLKVETSFGETNIIATGNPLHPPMILVHGSNGCAPIALETYPHLSQKFRVYAVDVIAQPNKSAEVRPSMKDESYGKWMNEVIAQLGITEVTMAGFSFGGLVILKTLEYDESNIKEVYLTVPAYVVNGNPIRALLKVFIPMKRFMKSKKMAQIEKFLSSLFTEPDDFALAFLPQVFLEFNMDFTPVPVINSKKAKNITTPITIFAADDDLLFPGEKMLKRASKIFPSLKESMLISQSKHVQSKEQNRIIEDVMIK